MAGDETSGIDAALADAAHVTGTVTDEAGDPLEGIFVSLRALEDGNWSYFGEAETAADGTYAMDGLRPGTNYRVSFESQGDWATEYWDDSITIDDATLVDLTNGQTLPESTPSWPRPLTSPARSPTPTATRTTSSPSTRTGGRARSGRTSASRSPAPSTTTPPTTPTTTSRRLIPGTYRLEFDAFDEIPRGLTEAAHEFWNDQPSLELAQDIVVTSAGQVLEGYDAVLVRDQYPNEVENLTAPAISGTPAVGQTLTASPGTWNLKAHDLPLPVARRHARPSAPTPPTYAPTAADVGKAISVVVTGAVAGIGSAAAHLGRRPLP